MIPTVSSSRFRIRTSIAASAALLLLTLPACGSSAEEAGTAAAFAAAAFEAGDYAAARGTIHQALSRKDDVAEYWLILARSELALREYGGALEAFRRAHELDRRNLEALQVLAELSILTGRLEDAEDYLDQIRLLAPQDPRARISQGTIALERGETAKALRTAEEVIRVDPRYLGAIVLKSKALAALKQYGKAAEILENAMRVYGQSAPVLEALLEIYRSSGNGAGERRTHERLVALSPQDPGLQIDLARALYRQGEGEAAFQQLLRLHRSRPDDQRVPGLIATLWLQLGNVPAGPREMQQMNSGGSPAMAIAMARYALDTRWPQEAARLLAPLIPAELSYRNAGTAGLYSEALLKTGRAGEAVALAERVLALDSANPRALAVRTSVALAERRLNDALAGALLVTSDNPRVSEYRALLARVYMARGEKNLALQTLKQAAVEFPTSSSVLGAYVDFLEREGSADRALVLADAFTARNRQSPDGWKIKAELCRKAGDKTCLSYSLSKAGEVGYSDGA